MSPHRAPHVKGRLNTMGSCLLSQRLRSLHFSLSILQTSVWWPTSYPKAPLPLVSQASLLLSGTAIWWRAGWFGPHPMLLTHEDQHLPRLFLTSSVLFVGHVRTMIFSNTVVYIVSGVTPDHNTIFNYIRLHLRLRSFEPWCHMVWKIGINVSGEPFASIFRCYVE
jgi:hypothetical protein